MLCSTAITFLPFWYLALAISVPTFRLSIPLEKSQESQSAFTSDIDFTERERNFSAKNPLFALTETFGRRTKEQKLFARVNPLKFGCRRKERQKRMALFSSFTFSSDIRRT